MGRLHDEIVEAVKQGRHVVSAHAAQRMDERRIAHWQLIAEIDDGELLLERPDSSPFPTINVRQFLADGTEVVVVWAWMKESRRAKLVTVYYPI